MQSASYVIGLGSNRRHGRHGSPSFVLAAARAALTDAGLDIVAASKPIRTPALGPSGRDFANAAILAKSALPPPQLLLLLKRVERDFGRRPGQRWGARVLDLDILAWSGGIWPPRHITAAPDGLAIPHRALAVRAFALGPAVAVAAGWRHPRLGLTLRHLQARRARRRPVDRRRGAS